MNFIPGVARGTRIDVGEGASVEVPRNAKLHDGQKVIYGTRPEHLSLGAEGQGLPASVVVVEPTGADTQVFAKFAGTELTAVFRERHDFKAGESIRLVPDLARTHVFDAETGKSLVQN
jgi:multiple sugar transport system ATP-binding protein